jgi:signal transduction histidine kinase
MFTKLRRGLSGLCDLFISADLKAEDAEPSRLYRARVSVIFNFAILFGSLALGTRFPLFSLAFTIFLGAFLSALLVLLVSRKLSTPERASFALLALWSLFATAFAISGQSIYTHFFTWMPVSIGMACFLGGIRLGGYFTLLMVCEALVVSFYAEAYGPHIGVYASPEHFMSAWQAQFILVELMGGVAVYIFSTVRERSDNELQSRRLLRAKTTRKAALAEVVGSLAHELNNPLAIVHASMLRYKRELSRGIDPTLRQQLWEHMTDALLRMEAVTHGLKTFSGGDVHEPMGEISFLQLFSLVERQLQEKIRSRGLCIVLDDPKWNVAMVCRPQQMIFVLSALLDNAMNAVKDQGDDASIRVSGLLNGSTIRLEVADNGPGVAGDVVESLFQPFGSRSDGVSLGMALSVCRGIIQEHGGRIGYTRVDGKTHFWLEIPLYKKGQP